MSRKTKEKMPVQYLDPLKNVHGLLSFDDPSGNHFDVRPDGVFRKEKGSTQEIKICDCFELIAFVRDENNKNWAIWVRLQDPDKQKHDLVVSLSLVAPSQGRKIEEIFASMGVRVPWSGSGQKSLLAEFLYAVPFEGLPRALRPEQGGFVNSDFNCFVAGGIKPLALDGAPLIAPVDDEIAAPIELEGSLEGWQQSIAAAAKYSVRMMLALCISLSGPLLPMVDAETTIFHFYCKSSQGKSSIVKAGAAVWAGESRVHSWRATDNALEGLAKMHNNQLLILDEIGQANAKGLLFVYAMTDAKEKARSTPSGKLRKLTAWRLPIISSGEFSMSEIRAQILKGEQIGVASGEAARFVAINADAGRGLGVLDSLPPCSSPEEEKRSKTERAAAFVKSISSMKNTGHAGRAFVMELMKDYAKNGKEKFQELLQETADIIREKLKQESALSQESIEQRVLDRFAVVAMAGELATDYGIMGESWEKGDATRAVIECFKAWRESEDSPQERQKRVVERFLELPSSEDASYLIYEWFGGEDFRFVARPNRSVKGTLVLEGKNDAPTNRAAIVAALYRTEQFNKLCKEQGEHMRVEEVIDALQKAGLVLSNTTGRRPQWQLYKGICEIKGGARVYVVLPEGSPESLDLAERMLKRV